MKPDASTIRPIKFILPIFFLSGASGLIFEIIWIRVFGNIFGCTVISASLVTAVFMAGLGLGGYLVGVYADRKHNTETKSLLFLYAKVELAIGCLGLMIAWILIHMEPLSAWVSSYVPDHQGWYHLSLMSYVFRYAIATLILLPSTILMGGTLTLLIRFLLAENLSDSSVRIGLLYGVNTAGAAAGCLLVGFVLVPTYGLFATCGVAAFLNLLAGFGATRLGKALSNQPILSNSAMIPPNTSEFSDEVGTAQKPISTRRSTVVVLTALAIFLSGFFGMGLEIVWFRLLTSILGEFRMVFSILLSVILIGIWLGSTLAGYVNRNWHPIQSIYFWCFASVALVVSSLGFISLIGPESKSAIFSVRHQFGGSSEFIQNAVVVWYRFKVVVSVVAIPSILFGVSFPIANSIVQKNRATIGRRAGFLYLYNTIGGVLGSLSAGFLLVPAFGTQTSLTILGILGLAIVAILLFAGGTCGSAITAKKWVPLTLGLAVVVGVSTLVAWARLPTDYVAQKGFTNEERALKQLALEESNNQTVAVLQTDPVNRALFTNGYLMTGSHQQAQRYMRFLAHLPLLLMEKPKKVLVICFGIGNTLHAASLHQTVESLEVADISKTILSFSKYFATWNHDILSDPRVSVFINDGRQHLRMESDSDIDLVTLEPPPLNNSGVSALYSEEFYQLAWARLKPGGFITQWLPAYQIKSQVTKSVIKSFINVFPGAMLFSGSEKHLILMGRKLAPIEFDPFAVQAKINSNPLLAKDLASVNLGSITEIVGTFVADFETLDQAVKGNLPVTDDYPLMEFHSAAMFYTKAIPLDIFNLNHVGKWCPRCFEGHRPVELMNGLDNYLLILDTWYRSDMFRLNPVPPSGLSKPSSFPMSKKDFSSAIAKSGYLRSIFHTQLN